MFNKTPSSKTQRLKSVASGVGQIYRGQRPRLGQKRSYGPCRREGWWCPWCWLPGRTHGECRSHEVGSLCLGAPSAILVGWKGHVRHASSRRPRSWIGLTLPHRSLCGSAVRIWSHHTWVESPKRPDISGWIYFLFFQL